MILCDRDLIDLMYRGFLCTDHDHCHGIDMSLVNPASVDVRIGPTAIVERGYGDKVEVEIGSNGIMVEPGEMVLVGTLEKITVPEHLAVDLRLKSTSARLGWDHHSALWIDPGFKGVITLELINCNRYTLLRLNRGQRIAQAVVHQLTGVPINTYRGRYQGATGVEGAKEET